MQKAVIPPVVALNEMLTGWLNGLNGTNAILLGLILGGMMAIDMGIQLIKRRLRLVLLCNRSTEFWSALSSYGWWYGTATCDCICNYIL